MLKPLEWREANLNEHVKVKLNETGLAIHKAYWEPFSAGKYLPPRQDSEGWSEFQIWEFANIFGPHFHNGAVVPCETSVLFQVYA